jgi:predicted Zn-dependent protease
MARRLVGFAPVPLLLILAACSTTPAPLTSDAASYGVDPDEKLLLKRATALDDEARRKGLLFTNSDVDAYVNEVGMRLVPASAANAVNFRFYVLREPLVNAFALPNGSIYVNVGLLARLENEAQLAQVLGHEVAHIVKRHSLDRQRSRRNTMIVANIADIALFGTSIAYLPAVGALAGQSRENEAEADRSGLEYMSAAGYPLAEADKLFTLIREMAPRESVWGSIYSSHPDNQDRAARASQYIQSAKLAVNTGAPARVEQYLKVRYEVALENIRLKLNVRQYQLAINSADSALLHSPKSAWLHYYRGEAYREMAEDPIGAAREQAWISGRDSGKEAVSQFRGKKQALLATATQSFRDALALDEGFAEGYRGLGLVAWANGDAAGARTSLKQYLDRGKEIKDRRYIESILGRLDKP